MKRRMGMLGILVLLGVLGLPGHLLADERTGGETIGSSVLILALPFVDGGDTSAATDDYDEPCPDGSGSPDLVYHYENAGEDISITIDLCDSDYDTKMFVYDNSGEVVACNDDFACGEDRGVQSRIQNLALAAEQRIYIIVDGSHGESGAYNLTVGADGACCLPDGACVLTTEELCQGTFQGPYTSCEDNPCPPSPVESATWSAVKGQFRPE